MLFDRVLIENVNYKRRLPEVLHGIITPCQNQPNQPKNKLFWLIFVLIFSQMNLYSYLCG